MLTRDELVELDRRLGPEKVLSVYLDGAESDPAERTSWRRALESQLGELRDTVRDRPHAEREAFAACVAHLMDSLGGFPGFLPAPGWVAYVTPSGVQHAESLPLALSTLAAWDDGIRIAPYVRALEQQRPAIVAVLDARKANVFRYELGRVTPLEEHRAHAHAEPVTHMGHPPGAGFHSGTRGVTGTDEAERERRAGRERMLREVAERLATLSAPDGWILLGGIPHATSEALAALPDDTRARAHLLVHLDVHASDAKIAARAARKIAELRSQSASETVDQIIAQSGDAANAVTGDAPTREALRDGAVDLLCVTERFIQEHPRDAEAAIRSALTQHADVDLVEGTPAERFDSAAGGIGARLRYLPWLRPSTASSSVVER